MVEHAHLYNARIYVTVNTILKEEELKETERMIWELYRIGVDALIVQDMGITRLNLPPIPLHGSTQMDNRTPEKVRFLADAGFRQVVLARELSLQDILEMIRKMNDICDRPVDGYELKINHFVNEIFYYIFHNVNLSKELSLKESRDLERMKDVMIYLNKTIDQKHTLADIASYCHLSNSECCRLFQRNVHLSPVDYLNQLRIHMSLSEIIKHEKKITDIAKMYGFSGSSYFSEMFKKTLGITPRAFYKSVLQQQTLSSNADPIHGRR